MKTPVKYKLKVFIAHDFLLLRKALVSLLSDQDCVTIIGESTSDNDVIDKCILAKPDVLLIHFPAYSDNITGLISRLKFMDSNIKILVISDLEGERNYLQFYRIGVNGVISLNSSQSSLIKAIKMIHGQNNFVKIFNENFEIFDLYKKVDTVFNKINKNNNLNLTPREKEVLKFISEGLTTRQISERLRLSKRTVDYFRASLIQKLQVKTTAGLIRSAIILTAKI